jgi:hypothetical protein
MPEIKRAFNLGKINRDLDDRLVPAGQYREALNINIGQSEGADVGAVENLLGNEAVASPLQFVGITDAKCIGSHKDNGTECIYFFVTDNKIYDETNPANRRHGIYEYDQKSKQLTTLVYTNQLNFHQNYPITGINFVDDLLFWTDNRNAPRKINVEKARSEPNYYTSASSVDDLISVCKFTPYESASILSVGTIGEDGNPITSNFLQNKLIRFSYRWKFEDGEYSVLAPFTPICFSRLGQSDTISASLSDFGEIETFVNAIKAVQLQIPTPQGFGITNVELIYKESVGATLYVVDDKEVTTESFVNFFYESQDPFRTLPPDQLTRVYDAVPRKALSQEVAGGRLVYGNFLQNYDLPTISFTVTRTGDSDARHPQLDYLSVKSRRTYQVGIVLADKFGRQSPVILSSNGKDTIYVDPGYDNADTTTAFNALRIVFNDTTQIPSWAYSYRVVVKQREQEYYNWISAITGANVVARLGDSINKIPRDQDAVIPPSTSATISPCDTSVYPKYVNGSNVYDATYGALTKVQSINNPAGTANVTTIDNSGTSISTGLCVYETKPVESDLDIFYETSTGGLVSAIPATAVDIDFFNCYLLTFDPGGTGDAHVELNRIRAGYNEPFFDIGVRAYVVQENFSEERRFNTLIHSSGLFNSRVGINYINQFNESEGGLTVSLDPQNGGVQKLFADDTQVIIFQEDKVSRSPIDKDFIYSAEGGAVPVTSNTQYLGTIAPYAGQFGIADNPLSFATYGFARYFTDRNRGAVLRLSNDGITEISQYGMGDFFRDILKTATEIVGSYDEFSRLYTLTIIGEGYTGNEDTNVSTAAQGYITITFDDRSNGFTSFTSFKQEGGLSLNNTYYTFSNGKLWQHNSENVTYNNFYGAGTTESFITPIFNDAASLVKQFNSLSYEGDEGWDLTFIKTDLNSIGTVPSLTTNYTTTLQLSGTADNSTFTGADTFIGKTGDIAQWVIFVEPISSAYQFTAANDVTLTPASGSTLTVTSPTGITNGNQLVFLVSHTVGSANSIQTLTVGGSGASLAFTVALLTVNIFDTVSNAAITPAVNTFTTAGNNNITFATVVQNGYYIDDTTSNMVIGTSGMPAATEPTGGFVTTSTRNNENLNYSITCVVPSTATSGNITATGTAIVKPTLTWAALTGTTGGVLATPSGTTPGTAYDTYPYDAEARRTATITWTVTNDTKVLFIDSYAVTSSVGSTTINKVLSNQDGILTATIVLPAISANTTATTTLTPTTNAEETAALGTLPSNPPAFATTGATPLVLGDDAAEKSNVDITVSPQSGQSWVLINGAAGSAAVEPNGQFTISAENNTTGAARSATVTVSCANTRITPALADHVININQN